VIHLIPARRPIQQYPPRPTRLFPTETTTPTTTPLPELVGQVESVAGGPCDLFRMGEFQFEGDWRIYEVFFTDPVQCKTIKQGNIWWVNYTHIEDKVVKYTKDFAHDIDSGALIDELERRLGVTINEMSQYALYPNKAGASTGLGIACLNDSNSIKGEYAACVGELRYYDNDNGFRTHISHPRDTLQHHKVLKKRERLPGKGTPSQSHFRNEYS